MYEPVIFLNFMKKRKFLFIRFFLLGVSHTPVVERKRILHLTAAVRNEKIKRKFRKRFIRKRKSCIFLVLTHNWS